MTWPILQHRLMITCRIIYSTLGISAADLVLLIETELTNASLNISNLTRLYQAVSLSKKLKLSIPEYVSMRGLSGIAPFGAAPLVRARSIAWSNSWD